MGLTVLNRAWLMCRLDGACAVAAAAHACAVSDWQQEFRRWAPDLNVVTYVGNHDSREIIRAKEFYGPPTASVRKPLKFNVLLTTYEMVLKDREELGYGLRVLEARMRACLVLTLERRCDVILEMGGASAVAAPSGGTAWLWMKHTGSRTWTRSCTTPSGYETRRRCARATGRWWPPQATSAKDGWREERAGGRRHRATPRRIGCS